MRPSYPVEPNVRKIAVLRANQLGDFIFILPALDALRATYPQAEIVLLGREWHKAFLEGRPGPVNRVIAIPPVWDNVQGLVNQADAPQLECFFEELRRESFDIAVQFHGGGLHSNPFVQQLGARLTIGLKTPEAPPLDRTIPYFYYQPEVGRYLEVVGLVGATPVTLEPRLSVTGADLAEAEKAVPGTGKPLVALHPGATDPRRRWPIRKFAEVGDALAQVGAQIVVTGTGPERELVAGITAAMRAEALNLCDKLSLNGLAGLLSRCRLLISNDSGPLHLAMAVGTPTAGIYWCGNLITAGPFTRRLHRPAISWQLTCPDCGVDCTKVRCAHASSFVDELSTEEVLVSALDLLRC